MGSAGTVSVQLWALSRPTVTHWSLTNWATCRTKRGGVWTINRWRQRAKIKNKRISDFLHWHMEQLYIARRVLAVREMWVGNSKSCSLERSKSMALKWESLIKKRASLGDKQRQSDKEKERERERERERECVCVCVCVCLCVSDECFGVDRLQLPLLIVLHSVFKVFIFHKELSPSSPLSSSILSFLFIFLFLFLFFLLASWA